jgi:hypothetical protein
VRYWHGIACPACNLDGPDHWRPATRQSWLGIRDLPDVPRNPMIEWHVHSPMRT